MYTGIMATREPGGREVKVKPHVYEIRVDGHLGDSWSPWLGDMTVCRQESGQTVLTGLLPDEPALHGVLAKIRDLGLPLVEVKRLATGSAATDAKEGSEG
jgi:hypothetical protein